jgi:hypothetical protein
MAPARGCGFSAYNGSADTASDKIYYVNLSFERKLLKIKEIHGWNG